MGNPLSRYKVEIYSKSGQLLADLSNKMTPKKILQQRNRADQISMTADLFILREFCNDIGTTVPALFAVNQNEIRVSRNNKVLSSGVIVYARPSVGVDSGTFELKAVGWLKLLAKRFTSIEQNYSGVDAGAIAWDLINQSQLLPNGDLGFTQGTIQVSKTRDRSYSDKNILDAILQLSEVIDGFDFEVTWDKKFNVYYPKIGTKRTDIQFTYPGNISDLSVVSDGTIVANHITARGSGTGTGALRAVAEDITSEQSYYRLEDIEDYNDVSEIDTLQEHADEDLRQSLSFNLMPDITLVGNITPEYGTYNLGDEILITSNDTVVFGTLNDYFRIDSMELNIDENNKETVRIKLMK